jgi:hypothetical protein
MVEREESLAILVRPPLISLPKLIVCKLSDPCVLRTLPVTNSDNKLESKLDSVDKIIGQDGGENGSRAQRATTIVLAPRGLGGNLQWTHSIRSGARSALVLPPLRSVGSVRLAFHHGPRILRRLGMAPRTGSHDTTDNRPPAQRLT